MTNLILAMKKSLTVKCDSCDKYGVAQTTDADEARMQLLRQGWRMVQQPHKQEELWCAKCRTRAWVRQLPRGAG